MTQVSFHGIPRLPVIWWYIYYWRWYDEVQLNISSWDPAVAASDTVFCHVDNHVSTDRSVDRLCVPTVWNVLETRLFLLTEQGLDTVWQALVSDVKWAWRTHTDMRRSTGVRFPWNTKSTLKYRCRLDNVKQTLWNLGTPGPVDRRELGRKNQ